MITWKDIMDYADIQDEVKAKAVADEINRYASNNNIDTQKIKEVLQKYKSASREELIIKNSELEGAKTILKQRLKSNLTNSELLKNIDL